jgi:hypothetical protein
LEFNFFPTMWYFLFFIFFILISFNSEGCYTYNSYFYKDKMTIISTEKSITSDTKIFNLLNLDRSHFKCTTIMFT